MTNREVGGADRDITSSVNCQGMIVWDTIQLKNINILCYLYKELLNSRVIVGAALENFPVRKGKKKGSVPRRQLFRNKILRAGRATSHPPPHCINRRNHTRSLHPKSTPMVLLLPYYMGKLVVLTTQLHRVVTCACDCITKNVSSQFPVVKKAPQSTKTA